MTRDHDEKAKDGGHSSGPGGGGIAGEGGGKMAGAAISQPGAAGAIGPAAAGSSSAAAGAPASSAFATIDDFAKIQLKVATIVEAKPHPNADKLLVLQIDLGGERRQICAGIRKDYQAEQLVGKQIVVVANLAPRPLRGEMSQGMLLAATDAASGRVIILSPSDTVAPGSIVK